MPVMTLQELRAPPSLEERVARYKPQFEQLYPRGDKTSFLNWLIQQGYLLKPELGGNQAHNLRALIELARSLGKDPENPKTLLFDSEEVFPGGYQAHKPAKLPAFRVPNYNPSGAPLSTLEAGLNDTFRRFEFPNERSGLLWASASTQLRQDNRLRFLQLYSLLRGTILAGDPDYLKDVEIDDTVFDAHDPKTYRNGARLSIMVPSVGTPKGRYNIQLLGIPLHKRGEKTTPELAALTRSLLIYTTTLFSIPYNLSYYRRAASEQAAHKTANELPYEHQQVAAAILVKNWIDETYPELEVPQIFPVPREDTLLFYRDLSQGVFTIAPRKPGDKSSPQFLHLDDWEITQLLNNYVGLNNQKPRR